MKSSLVLALAVGCLMLVPGSILAAVDQMVVSVGPYILKSSPQPVSRFASAGGRASPPTSSFFRRRNALRARLSCNSMEA